MSYNIVEYHNIKLYSNMEALYTILEELPQTISSHIRNCLQVTWVVSVSAGDFSNIVSTMLVGVQKEDCQPTNNAETISETSPAVALTPHVTSRQFLIWLDIACGNSSGWVYNASILLYNVSTNSSWRLWILSSVKVSWRNYHWTIQKKKKEYKGKYKYQKSVVNYNIITN